MQSFLVREIHLSPGKNTIAVAGQHAIIGAARNNEYGSLRPSTIALTIAENTSMTNSEEGLVYRQAYVGYVGESIPFSLTNLIDTAYVVANGQHPPMVVLIFPSEKR